MDCGVMSSCVWSPAQHHAGLVSAVHHAGGMVTGCPPMTDDPCGSILELRKEKSRDAARSRRGKENYEFYELAKMLPLPAAITSQLDKASIIRLTISYLKLRDFSSHGDPPWNRDGPPPNKSVKTGPPRRRNMTAIAMEVYEMHQGTHILQSLDGFAFALANDGRFLYISETVSIYLGLSQLEMTGSSIFDYVHPKDHPELADQLGLCLTKVEMTGSSIFDYIHHRDQSEVAEQLGMVLPQGGTTGSSSSAAMPSPGSAASDEGSSSTTTPRAVSPSLQDRAALMTPSAGQGYARSFCIRMKSTLTKRGVHVKSSGYRVVHVLAHMRPQFSFSLTRKHPPPVMGLVAMAIALPPPTINELLIDNDMFVTRLSPEFKVIYCEPRISDLMDISADDLTNKNLYDYCHAEDLQKIRKSHVDLLTKGQVLTEYYRLLNKHGGYIWIQTCATTICNNKNPEDQNIIAINYVLSGIEYGGCVMDTSQMENLPKNEPDTSDHSESEAGSDKGHKDEHQKKEEKRSMIEKLEDDINPTKQGHKRKHSCKDDNTAPITMAHNLHDITSSEEPTIMTYSSKTDDNYNSVFVDESKYGIQNERHRLDSKNSRRKMERPRKRKRESESEHEDVDASINNQKCIENLLSTNSNMDACSDNDNASVQEVVQSNVPSSPQDVSLRMQSPGTLPEDLSIKQVQVSAIRHSPTTHTTASTPTPSTPRENGKDIWPTTSSASSTPDPHCNEANVSSSVRDLEEVMNKHLPSLPLESDPLRSGFHADFAATHAAALSFQKHKSTIQWIGSQQPTTDTLPATSLLRHLYANRESVIRTNVYNTRPQFYSDMQASLLTPPGGSSEAAYKDAAAHFSASQMAAKSQASAGYAGLSAYTTNPISVTMSTGSETYSMTPPSSVSPQEKYPSPFTEPCYDAGANQYRQYMVTAEGSTLPMPIKPQAYPLPAHAHSASSYERSGPQYVSPPSYYGAASGFTAYGSSPTPAHYHETTKNTNSW